MARRNEKIAVAALVFVALIAVAVLFVQERKSSKQKLMYFQLQSMRTSVNLFKSIENRNPRDLEELMKGSYRFPGENQERRYIEMPPSDVEGRFVDPFGNPYDYNPETGWVGSRTPGYEYW